MSCVQLSEGGFQVVYPLGLWPRSSGVVKSPIWIWLGNYLHLHLQRAVAALGRQRNCAHVLASFGYTHHLCGCPMT